MTLYSLPLSEILFSSCVQIFRFLGIYKYGEIKTFGVFSYNQYKSINFAQIGVVIYIVQNEKSCNCRLFVCSLVSVFGNCSEETNRSVVTLTRLSIFCLVIFFPFSSLLFSFLFFFNSLCIAFVVPFFCRISLTLYLCIFLYCISCPQVINFYRWRHRSHLTLNGSLTPPPPYTPLAQFFVCSSFYSQARTPHYRIGCLTPIPLSVRSMMQFISSILMYGFNTPYHSQ